MKCDNCGMDAPPEGHRLRYGVECIAALRAKLAEEEEAKLDLASGFNGLQDQLRTAEKERAGWKQIAEDSGRTLTDLMLDEKRKREAAEKRASDTNSHAEAEAHAHDETRRDLSEHVVMYEQKLADAETEIKKCDAMIDALNHQGGKLISKERALADTLASALRETTFNDIDSSAKDEITDRKERALAAYDAARKT